MHRLPHIFFGILVFVFMFRSIVPYEVIFVCGVMYGLKFYFFLMALLWPKIVC